MSFLNVQNLSKTYAERDHGVPALKDVSFALARGESLAIVGSSGAGKSTLLNILGGLDRPSAGSVHLEGRDLAALGESEESRFRRENLGFIFQFHHLLADFNILENVMLPLLIQGRDRRSSRDDALVWLDKVGLSGLEKRSPRELSGGEQQRVAIARALVHRPKVVLADEPTGNLDQENGRKVFELLCRLNHDLQATLVVVTHNEDFSRMLKRRLHLHAGRVASFV